MRTAGGICSVHGRYETGICRPCFSERTGGIYDTPALVFNPYQHELEVAQERLAEAVGLLRGMGDRLCARAGLVPGGGFSAPKCGVCHVCRVASFLAKVSR